MVKNSTTALQLDNPFWRYALRLWQHPDIEAACLELQQAGLSINRLLYCFWLAEIGRQLPEHCQEADHWQQQLSHPQRALRFQVRALKNDQPELDSVYTAMRKAELACEQIEIAWLYQHSQQASPACHGTALAEANLREWLDRQQRTSLWSHPALQTLLSSIKTDQT